MSLALTEESTAETTTIMMVGRASRAQAMMSCLTVEKPIRSGQQIKTGSCNPATMVVVSSTANMPSFRNLEARHFVSELRHYAAPQQINDQRPTNLVPMDMGLLAALPARINDTSRASLTVERCIGRRETMKERSARKEGFLAPL
ncbi:hypothetical protein BJV74DRAFT_988597 [Russula compacta]|nr:hypothetical protein BJV74DRAFT_988597 [Russula compacta]